MQLVLILLRYYNLLVTARSEDVADEISAKLLSSFLEYEVLVVVTDRYDFEFSIKGAE